MTDEEMKEVLESTLMTQRENASYRKRPRPDAHLATPVAQADLSRLEKHVARLGVNVPPSFIQFLRLTDGIVDYMQINNLSLRSAKEIVDSQQIDDRDHDEFAPLHEFIFASGDTREFLAFDDSRVDPSGEMPVVWVDLRGQSIEFGDFPEFLREQLKFQKDVLKGKKGDRANLPAD